MLAGTLTGRLPCGMAPLAVFLAADGPAAGASLAAVYPLASAVGGPLSARLADRIGQRRALSAGCAVSTGAFLLLVAVHGSLWWSVAAVAVAGAGRPPLEAALRSRWGSSAVMPSPGHRRTALALDSGSQEVIYIAGPLLVTVIAQAASASWAIVATAVTGAAGTALFVTALQSRNGHANSRRSRGDWLGPVRVAGLRVLYAAMACAGFSIGSLTPVAVQAAHRFEAPALAGALPAALSAGAVIGALLYGARPWRGGTGHLLSVLSAVFAAGWLLLAIAPTAAAALGAVLVPGLAMAPLLGTGFVVTSALAPPGRSTEAHALLVAALDIGCATGTAAAGMAHTPLLLPVGAAAAALICHTARRRLTPSAAVSQI
ncbi:MFS transporter [Streptomyces arenae]|uniref:MFS transporter n=1 Tax=Streptomyces arenae TaxID=29301 RepID=UPI00265AC345|nr:MFS transporter [Streptomyces arenae]MCG7202300.1 MFS transporter [Streptomyces arenae]